MFALALSRVALLTLIYPDYTNGIISTINRAPLSTSNITRLSGSLEMPLAGGPLLTGCYTTDISVGSHAFKVWIDTGSSDLIIPGKGINHYSGPVYNIEGKSALSPIISSSFADGSTWTGEFYLDTVAIGGNVSITAPFAAILQQSTNPTVADGDISQGILGIAFDNLSRFPGNPKTVMTALYSSDKISRDLVAFRGCPANSKGLSLIDWGAEDSSLTCANGSNESAWAKVVTSYHFAVNVLNIRVGSTDLLVPKDRSWQDGINSQSIVDSCTTLLFIPKYAHDFLMNSILNSGVLQQAGLSRGAINNFLYSLYGISDIVYQKLILYNLPNISFTLEGNENGQFINLTLTPQNYIQSNGFGYNFLIVRPGELKVIFGAVVHDVLYIVYDRGNSRIGFGPGCDCNGSNSASVVAYRIPGSFSTMRELHSASNTIFPSFLSLFFSLFSLL